MPARWRPSCAARSPTAFAAAARRRRVSVAIDGGGALHLDALARRHPAARRRDAGRPAPARRGRRRRARAPRRSARSRPRDVDRRRRAAAATRSRRTGATRGRATSAPRSRARAGDRSAARHARPPNRSGRTACATTRSAVGVGFPFGHTDARRWKALDARGRAAGATRRAAGARSRAARRRPRAAARRRVAAAAAEDSASSSSRDDPRRRIVACAGAPICALGRDSRPARSRREVAQPSRRCIAAGRGDPHLRLRQGLRPSGRRRRSTAIGRDGACDLLVDGAPAGSCESTAAGRSGSDRSSRAPAGARAMAEPHAYLRDGAAIYAALVRDHPGRSRSLRLLGRGGRGRGAHDPCLRPGRGGAAHRVRPRSRRGGARRARGRRADPVRRRDGGARHHARAPAGAATR